MEKENAVKIVEVCKISPSSHSSSKFSLPLAAFDWLFINFPPLDRVIYYSISHNYSDSFFHSIIIPKLKHSLSLTLSHFLPLAGNLLWPADSPLPFILYSPNDAVSFTVAETDSDFHRVSGNHPRQIKDSYPFVPMIQPPNSSATAVPLMAVQVTHFPNHGFCIGLSTHHVLLDDKSFSLFFKSWAHINRCQLESLSPNYNLPSEFTPSFERPTNVLRNPLDFVPKKRSLKFSQLLLMSPSNWILGTFELTPTHIEKLKKRVLEEIEDDQKGGSEEELHLSTFVVAYAYALICLIKAKQGECKEVVHLSLAADVRGLLDPPISSNYFGNCVTHRGMLVEAREFREEGFANIVKKISHLILEVKGGSSAIEAHKPPDVDEQQHSFLSEIEACTVVASPKFKYYQNDFGWGNPNKCEIVSLGSNNIALTDTRDGDGGIEVSLLLPNPHQMDIFVSLIAQCLN
ncbi:phenolic glucoside malonyltransferase 1-like [Momordica charantia]|uniref:Phenolic glucoside malonyltransferase 1-like n=1 Tax=Momordica charantia TaxID=3673 RepID=A0A6J1BWL1_MOMCH|nr:phenolic glucoside malonyltransferase 1-like [Momordica charantia]